MALINCPDCKSEISDKAKSCIKCGCPIVKQKDHSVKIKTREDVRVYKKPDDDEGLKLSPAAMKVSDVCPEEYIERTAAHNYSITQTLTMDLEFIRDALNLNESQFIDYARDNFGKDIKRYYDNINYDEYTYKRAVDFAIAATYVTVPLFMAHLSVSESKITKIIVDLQKNGILGKKDFSGAYEALISRKQWEKRLEKEELIKNKEIADISDGKEFKEYANEAQIN